MKFITLAKKGTKNVGKVNVLVRAVGKWFAEGEMNDFLCPFPQTALQLQSQKNDENVAECKKQSELVESHKLDTARVIFLLASSIVFYLERKFKFKLPEKFYTAFNSPTE